MKQRTKPLIEAAHIMYGRRLDPMLITPVQFGMDCIGMVRVGDVVTGKASSCYTGPIPAPPMKYLVKKGDIVVSMTGNFHVNRWDDQDALLDLRVMRIRGKYNSTSTDYLYHYLQPVFKRIEETIVGHRTKNLSTKTINQIEVFLPPFKEQERIAEVLNGYTEQIDRLKAQIEQRQQQLITFRDELFDIENEPGTVMTTLGELCLQVYGGGTPKTSIAEYYQGNIPWLRTQEIDWNEITDTPVKISEAAVAHSQAELIPTGCIIVAMYGSTAGKAAINRIPLCTNQACCNLQVNPSKALPEYVFYWLQREHAYLKALGEGSRGNLNATKIKTYPIVLPPFAEQRRIVNAINTYNKETTQIEKTLGKREKEYERQKGILLINIR